MGQKILHFSINMAVLVYIRLNLTPQITKNTYNMIQPIIKILKTGKTCNSNTNLSRAIIFAKEKSKLKRGRTPKTVCRVVSLVLQLHLVMILKYFQVWCC